MLPVLIWSIPIACCVLLLLWRLALRGPADPSDHEGASFFERFGRALERDGVEVMGLGEDGRHVVVRMDRQELLIPLSETFLLGKAFPAGLQHAVEHIVNELALSLASLEDYHFDEALCYVQPQVRSHRWVRDNSPALGEGRILTRPICGDLVECSVIDEPGAMVFVTEGHLRVWGCSADCIANFALGNLKALAADEGGLPLPEGREPVLLRTGDGYAAARLLLAFEESLRPRIEQYVFAVPDRDTLVACRADGDLDRLAEDVWAEYGLSEHPVSKNLFRVSGKRLLTLDGPAPRPIEHAPTS
ncbi:MAG: hypothetical protein ACE5F1_00130 [Planctomycetota bacterium]